MAKHNGRRGHRHSGAATGNSIRRWPSRRRVAAVLFIGLSVLYFCNFRLRGAGDSLPTRVLPFSILREANLDLNEFTWASLPERPWPYYIHAQGPAEERRFFSVSSIATSIVVTPLYVLPSLWLAWGDVSYNDTRARVVMVLMEKASAALLAALSAVLLFLALCRITTERWALALTLLYALGTSTWSISSQALWAHALGEVCLAALCLLMARGGGSWRWYAAVGAACVLMVWNRAQMAPFALMGFLYVVSLDRRIALPLTGAAAVPAAVLIGYNVWALGNPFGGYGKFDHFSNPLLAGLGGLTISPNRGLFVFTPIALFSVWGAVEVWRRGGPRWLRFLTVGLAMHVLMYAKFDEWWAGYTYGPRYFTDVQPLLVVLLVYGLVPLWHLGAVRLVAVSFAAWSIFVQAVGTYAADDEWNREPISVDTRPQRVWDWDDTQIGRSLANGFRGFELLPVMVDAFTDPVPASFVELSREDLASRIAATGIPARMRAGESTVVELQVTNLGSAAWPAFSGKGLLDIRHLVFVVQTWRVGDRQVAGVGEVELVPESIAPGESFELRMPLVAPPARGVFDVEIRITQAIDGRRGIASPDAVVARVVVD